MSLINKALLHLTSLLLVVYLPHMAQAYPVSAKLKSLAQEVGFPVKKNYNESELNFLLQKICSRSDYKLAQIVIKNKQADVKLIQNLSHEINFVGNQALTEKDLLSLLKTKKNTSYSFFEMEQKVPVLKRAYQKQGLLKIDISIQEFLQPKRKFVLTITEGQSSQISSFSVLSKNIILNQSIKSSLSSFLRKDLNSQNIVDISRSVQEELVRNRAFSARIDSISPVYSKNRSSAQVVVNLVDEMNYEFVFLGLRSFNYKDIMTYIDVEKNYLNFIKNKSLLSRYVEDFYIKKGYLNTEVFVTEISVEDANKVIFKFDIKEGTQLKTHNIYISGKISRSSSYYIDIFKQALGEQNNSSYFIKSNIDESVKTLINKLKNQGYLRAKLISYDYKIRKSGLVNLSIQIDEGPLTQVRSITFKGITQFTSNQLLDVIELKPNDALNLNLVEQSFERLINFYKKNGFLDFNIKTKKEDLISYYDNFQFADLNFDIHEGPKVIIDNIYTRGNKKTKNKVILREVDLEKGNTLTSDSIRNSIIFLERTQLFSRAQINTNNKNTDISERDVYIDVQEKKPGLFSLGMGLSNEQNQLTYRGYLGLSYKNLGGSGRGVSARADANYATEFEYLENRVVLGYYEPFFMFNRLRLRSSLIHEEDIFENTDDDQIRVSENDQISFLLEKQFTPSFRFTWKIFELSLIKTFNKDNTSDSTSLEVSRIGPILEWDRRDDLFLPRDGTFTNLQADYSAPFLGSTSDNSNYIHFLKVSGSHTLYTPLTSSKRWVWVNSLSGGYLRNFSDLQQSGVPATEAYFFGTRATIRGYNIAEGERIPRLDEICNNCLLERFRVRSESHFFLLKSELRFPLYENTAGLLFYDGGAVYINSGSRLEDDGTVTQTDIAITDHYRDSAGFGLRYETPIGSFTAELGFKLDRKKEIPGLRNAEDLFNFHISMVVF